MRHQTIDSLNLKQVGIRPLPEERLEVAVELEGGLTEELGHRHTALLLTNKRLIRYSATGDKINVVTANVESIDSIEVKRTGKNRQWVWVGLVFMAGGLLLGLMSLFFPVLSRLHIAHGDFTGPHRHSLHPLLCRGQDRRGYRQDRRYRREVQDETERP